MFGIFFKVSLLCLWIGLSVQFQCTDEFKEAFLAKHNEYRAKHGVPMLTLVDEINESAQKWADYLGENHKFKHSGAKYGENLWGIGRTASAKPEDVLGESPVNTWYREIKNYHNFSEQPHNWKEVSHFSQVVWKKSLRLGVGCGLYPDKDFFVVVGQYEPRGNVVPRYPGNVPPPLDSESVTEGTDGEK